MTLLRPAIAHRQCAYLCCRRGGGERSPSIGANLTVSEDEVRQCRPAIAAADILMTQLENNLPAIEQVIAIAREAQTFIILNPARSAGAGQPVGAG